MTLRGHFTPGPVAAFTAAQLPILHRFAQLSPEQLELLDAFVRCEGKLNRLQEVVGLSYPTLRSRLNDMLEALGVTPEVEDKARQIDRARILDQVAAGKLSAAEAADLLRSTRGN